MAAAWYCRIDGDELGPMPPPALKQLVLQGRVNAETLVRQGEQGKWVPAGKVKGLLSGESPSTLKHDSAQLVGAGAGSSKTAKPAEKTPQAQPARPAASPATARPAAPKPAVRHSGSFIAAAPPSSAKSAAGGERVAGRRRRKSIVPLLVTAAVLLVLAVGTAAVVIISYLIDSAHQAVAQAGDALQEIANPGVSPNAGGNSSGTVRAVEPAPPTRLPGPNVGESPDDYRRRVVQSIDQWRPALNRVGGTKKMKVRVDKVWLGADAGRDVSPEFVPAESAAKFVFVRVVINNNASDELLDYPGWNTSDVAEQAILIDDRDQFCRLVSLDQSRNERLPPTQIAAKQAVTDILVFHAPRHPFEFLRLAVPFDNGNHYGLQIDRSMLAATGPASVPRQPSAGSNGPPLLEVDPSTPQGP